MHIDIKQWDLLSSLNLRDLLLSSAVHLIVHLAMLNELIIGNHLLELVHADEVVVDAILFAVSGRARRVRDAKAEFIGELFLHKVDESALSST